MLNRWVLSRDRKTPTEGAEMTRSGRLFQTRATATGKARSPTVRSRVRLTISDEDEWEPSRWRASTSATWQNSSVRYAGANPCRHLCTRTACLNAIRSGAFSQCSWRMSRVMCWNLDEEKISRAAASITDCSCDGKCDEMPASVELLLSSCKRTRGVSVLINNLCKSYQIWQDNPSGEGWVWLNLLRLKQDSVFPSVLLLLILFFLYWWWWCRF